MWTMFHSGAFDFSVWEMWGALTTGGRLVPVDAYVARSTPQFAQLLVDEGVTVLNQTPSGVPGACRDHAVHRTADAAVDLRRGKHWMWARFAAGSTAIARFAP